MLKELNSREAASRFLLKTTSNKIPQIARRSRRRFRRIRVANSAHKARPIPLSPNILPKWKFSQIELQYADPKTPDIAGVSVIVSVIQIGIDPLRTHISYSAHR
ncbi:hypothetical protein IEQ34_005885 [Dendrobium chrysotoxum]|uniref:Uncharacterized protein n=1 Tax=Dendrobium chrysotoxum TaxID=161865 RepID=A0AAV7HD18_DENCH|nr:hypothetical protein IEQ34_005885 [Dendrobium chrysotoxum]